MLPGAAYTEKNATFVNFEGRSQRTKVCIFAKHVFTAHTCCANMHMLLLVRRSFGVTAIS